MLDALDPRMRAAARVARRRGDRAQGGRVRRAAHGRSVVRAADRRPRSMRRSMLGVLVVRRDVDAAPARQPELAASAAHSCAQAASRGKRQRVVTGACSARASASTCSRDFHPNDHANDHLAHAWFAARGLRHAGGRMKRTDRRGHRRGQRHRSSDRAALRQPRCAGRDLRCRSRRGVDALAAELGDARVLARTVDVADRAQMAAFADAVHETRRRSTSSSTTRASRSAATSSTPVARRLGLAARHQPARRGPRLPLLRRRRWSSAARRPDRQRRRASSASSRRRARPRTSRASSPCSGCRSRCAPSSSRTASASPRSARA